jgi:hypothetical protein
MKDETQDEDTRKTHIYIYIYKSDMQEIKPDSSNNSQVSQTTSCIIRCSNGTYSSRTFPDKSTHHAKTSTVASEILSTLMSLRRAIFNENVSSIIYVCVIQENVPQTYEGHQQSATSCAVFLLSLPTRKIVPANIYVAVVCELLL